MFAQLRRRGFDIKMMHHAEAILRHDMPDCAQEIEAILETARIPCDELVRSGGGESKFTQRLRRALVMLTG